MCIRDSANLLLKYLGERGGYPADDPRGPLLGAGIAVSPPFVLRDAMLLLNQGASRLYRSHLITRLKRAFQRKFAASPCPVAIDLDLIRDFNAFDEGITAPLCGFAGVFDYYNRASCRGYLPAITTPTLIIHALDDPFMFPASPSLTFWPPDSAENPYIPALSEDRPKPDQSLSGRRLRVVP